MKTDIYVIVAVGIFIVLGAYVYALQTPDSEFCTDTSILTMKLPVKEGIDAKPTFSMKTSLPTVPDAMGIYTLSKPTVTADSVKQKANLVLSKQTVNPSLIKNVALTQVQTKAFTPVQKLSPTALKASTSPDTQVAATNPAAKVNLNMVNDLGSTFTFETETAYLAVDKSSGAESVSLDTQASLSERKTALPDESVLKQNADTFVSQNNILPEGYQYAGMTYLNRQKLGQNGPEGAVEKVLGVAKYTRTIQGIPVEGAGSTVCVMLGDEGKVQGYNIVSRTLGQQIAVASPTALSAGLSTAGIKRRLEKVNATTAVANPVLQTGINTVQINPNVAASQKPYQLLSPEEAFAKLQERGLTTEIADVSTATVTDMYLAYYESEGNQEQTETEPIYVFKGVATGPGGTTEYKEIMYALASKAGKAPFEKTSTTKVGPRDASPTTAAAVKD